MAPPPCLLYTSGRVPKDWDITTSAKPEEVKQIFRKTIDTGIAHGTVTVMVEGTGYEVTTYRVDGEYAVSYTHLTGTASAAGSRRLDLLLRKDGKYWKILYGMWHAKTGRTSRLDLLLRNIESGEILHELWRKETGRRSIVPL